MQDIRRSDGVSMVQMRYVLVNRLHTWHHLYMFHSPTFSLLDATMRLPHVRSGSGDCVKRGVEDVPIDVWCTELAGDLAILSDDSPDDALVGDLACLKFRLPRHLPAGVIKRQQSFTVALDGCAAIVRTDNVVPCPCSPA